HGLRGTGAGWPDQARPGRAAARGRLQVRRRGEGRAMTAGAFTRRYGLLIVLVVLVAIALLSGVTDRISLGELRERRQELVAFVDAHWLASIAVFAALYTTVVALSLPLALVLTLTGGFLFGPVIGALAAVS